MAQEHIDTFRDIELFADLDDDGIARVAAMATEVEVRAGHVFVERGHPGAGCFVVLEGRVGVIPTSGVEIERGPGDVIGEMSVLTDSARSARVHAITDVRCLAIARDDLLALIHDEPAIAVALLRVVARRLAEAT